MPEAFEERWSMKRLLSPRWFLAVGALAALVVGSTLAADRSSSAMAAAAGRFLDGLTPDARQQASFPFNSDQRLHWHFIPTETFPRKGLTIKQMTQPQRKLAHDLLKAGLSQRGYMTASQIMDLETILGALEASGRSAEVQPARGPRLVRDPEGYFFSIFGTPSTHDTWGWRVEGHHVSLNFTVVNGTLVASSPSFFGSNPARVPDGPKKDMRILAAEEDAARALVESLDAPQREKAIINTTAPADIITTNKVKIDPLSPAGISAAALNGDQRTLLMRLVDVYTGYMASDVAADRMARLRKAGEDKIAFAWAGELERGKKHYYRVQGPTFLIEYDNTQNDGNHIHSVWRDFNGDFGQDLLREHVKSTPHE
jgi:hypothetical protein